MCIRDRTYNNLTERTAKQSALILVAVDIVNEVLKLKLNKEAIGDFMEEHSLVNSVEQVSIGKRECSSIKSPIASLFSFNFNTSFTMSTATSISADCFAVLSVRLL